jgi:exopolyphosphatase/guanosine-5'-triphosphate,3'-diphosphate pyrophosphatase
VCNHRRKLYPETVTRLPQAWHLKTWRLILILRLAVLLNRTRAADDMPVMRADVLGETLRVRFPAGWLEQHPLSLADLRQEAAFLKRSPVKLDFS